VEKMSALGHKSSLSFLNLCIFKISNKKNEKVFPYVNFKNRTTFENFCIEILPGLNSGLFGSLHNSTRLWKEYNFYKIRKISHKIVINALLVENEYNIYL